MARDTQPGRKGDTREVTVTFGVDGARIGSLVCEVATSPGHDLKPGQEAAVAVDPREVHVFESGGRPDGDA